LSTLLPSSLHLHAELQMQPRHTQIAHQCSVTLSTLLPSSWQVHAEPTIQSGHAQIAHQRSVTRHLTMSYLPCSARAAICAISLLKFKSVSQRDLTGLCTAPLSLGLLLYTSHKGGSCAAGSLSNLAHATATSLGLQLTIALSKGTVAAFVSAAASTL